MSKERIVPSTLAATRVPRSAFASASGAAPATAMELTLSRKQSIVWIGSVEFDRQSQKCTSLS